MDNVREEFEARFEIPERAEWWPDSLMYGYKTMLGAHPINEIFIAFCAGKNIEREAKDKEIAELRKALSEINDVAGARNDDDTSMDSCLCDIWDRSYEALKQNER